jgi:hypothetical protein
MTIDPSAALAGTAVEMPTVAAEIFIVIEPDNLDVADALDAADERGPERRTTPGRWRRWVRGASS